MKNFNLSLFLFISIFFIFSSNSYSQVVIGTDASPAVPTLNQAIGQGLITVNNGVISQDFNIKGNLTINYLQLVFDNVHISMDGGNIEIWGSDLRFTNNSALFGGGVIEMYDETYFRVEKSFLGDFFRIDIYHKTYLDLVSNSIIKDIEQGINLLFEDCFLNGFRTRFDDAAITGHSSSTVILNSCKIFGGNSWGVKMINGNYGGKYNLYDTSPSSHGIKVDQINNLQWVTIKEEGSTFNERGGPAVDLRSATYVDFRNNYFNNESISVSGGIQGIATVISNNNFTDGSIVVSLKQGVAIENNVFNDIFGTPSNPQSAIQVTGISNISIVDNYIDIENHGIGIRADACTDAIIHDNTIQDGKVNMLLANLENPTISSNILYDSEEQNFMMTDCEDAVLCDNSMFGGFVGFQLNGINFGLDFKDNHFHSSFVGLYYRNDVMTAKQDNKGNDFNGSFFIPAQFNGMTTGDPQLSSMRFKVPSNSTEFPTGITPDGWFEGNGFTNDCLPQAAQSNNWSHSEQYSYAIGQSEEVSVENTGMSKYVNYHLIQRLSKHSELLSNESFQNFYAEGDHHFLKNALYLSDIVNLGNEFGENFEDLPEPSYNELGILLNSDDYTEYLDTQSEIFAVEKAEFLDNININLAALDELSSEVELENDLFQVNKILLRLKTGIQPNSEEYNTVIDLANSCIEEYGPAVVTARVIMSVVDENYLPFDCRDTDIEERNNFSEVSPTNSGVALFPNPAKDYLTIENEKKADVLIYDMSGTLRLSHTTLTNVSTINISELPTGLYYIRLKGENKTYKFVKIQ